MHNLGHTRSTNQRDHLLHTPDTFIRTILPGMKNAAAIVHISPAIGASFTQYTAELEPEGTLGDTTSQRFIYVLEGTADLATETAFHTLTARRLRLHPRRNTSHLQSATTDTTGSHRKTLRATSPISNSIHPRRRREHHHTNCPGRRPRPPGPQPSPRHPRLRLRRQHHDLPARSRTQHGRSPHHGARTPHARRRRHLPPQRSVVSRHRRRRHLDGPLLPAVVRSHRQTTRKIPHLQRLEPSPPLIIPQRSSPANIS